MINYLCEIEQNGKIIKGTRKNIAIKKIDAPKEIRQKLIHLYAMQKLYKEYIGKENKY